MPQQKMPIEYDINSETKVYRESHLWSSDNGLERLWLVSITELRNLRSLL